MAIVEDVAADWLLGGAVRLHQADRGFKATVDAILLAAFAPARSGEHALDVGSGVGSATLCLAARLSDLRIDGVDIQPDLSEAANANAALNGWSDRVSFAGGDVAAPPAALRRAYDGVLTNPPYLSALAADPPQQVARRLSMVESSVDWAGWAAFCLDRLKPGGWFACVHRADRLPEILAPMTPRLGAIDIVPVRPRADADASRVLLRGWKGAKGAARLRAGLTLHGDGGDYSDEARRVLRAPTAFDAIQDR